MNDSSPSAAAESLLRLLHTAGRLKETARAGWVLRGVEAPESVADHSWRVALLALLLAPAAEGAPNPARAVAVALVHDLAESLVGDITPFDGVDRAEKRRREEAAMLELSALAPDAGLLELWREYDAGESAEARLVKQLDALETALQAAEYARRSAPGADALAEFQAAAERRLHPGIVRELFEALQREQAEA